MTLLVKEVLFTTVALALYVIAVKVYRAVRNLPPGPVLGVPVFGDFLLFSKTGYTEFLRRRTRVFGNVFFTNFFGIPLVSITSVSDVQKILSASGEVFEGYWPPSTSTLIGKYAVPIVEGEHHKMLRRLMEPSLKEGVLRSYLHTIVLSVRECLDHWAEEGYFNAMAGVKSMTVTVLLRVGLGYREGDLEGKELEKMHKLLMVWVEGLFSAPINLPGFAFHKAVQARAQLDKMLKLHIDRLRKRIEAGDTTDQLGERLVAAADENGQPLSPQILLDNMVALLFAGHDTTAITALMILFCLGKDSRILAQLKAEQSQVREAYGEEITPEALEAMRYAEAVVKEGLRWRTPVACNFRQARETVQIGGYTIPKGTVVNLGLGAIMQLDPRWAEEVGEAAPDNFYPERWLTEAGKKAGSFIPFGLGVRLCPGWRLAMLELKVFLALLSRDYTWELMNPDAKWVRFLYECPVDGLPIRISKTISI
eukprot:jgi/Botrbrau1/12983/Bobra.384_1s0008.1